MRVLITHKLHAKQTVQANTTSQALGFTHRFTALLTNRACVILKGIVHQVWRDL